MPITPFHFGPGALFKVLAPRHFSWTCFALANILIDLEPVTLFLLIGDPAHPWLHTLPGALAVAAIAAIVGRKPCEALLAFWNRQLSPAQARWLAVVARDFKVGGMGWGVGRDAEPSGPGYRDACRRRGLVAPGAWQHLAGHDFAGGAASGVRCGRGGGNALLGRQATCLCSPSALIRHL